MFATDTLKSALLQKTGKLKKNAEASVKLKATAAMALPNDLLPHLEIERRDISTLAPSKRRTRKGLTAQIKRIAQSTAQFGFIGAILVKDGRIVDGHARLAAMAELGQTQIPVIDVKHLSETQARVLALSMNRIQEKGEWDLDAVRDEIVELEVLEVDLGVTGFTIPERDILKLAPEPDKALLDQVPPAQEFAVTAPGDVWAFGGHVLVCGDALDPDVYALLMGEDCAAGVFTDPPYNCVIPGNVSGLGKKTHDNFAMACGEMPDEEFRQFLASMLANCRDHCLPGAVLFACMNWRQYPQLEAAGRDAGLKQLSMVVWDKGSGGMGSPYRSAHELVGVFCNGNKPARNNIELGKNGRDRTNVWHYAGANRPGSSAAKMLAEHPTPKPVEMVVQAMLDFTAPGELVLDPFMGSGTTIIAAQECQRVARGIELDPKYVDVALRRWIKIMEEMPVLIETGETFAEVAARRISEK